MISVQTIRNEPHLSEVNFQGFDPDPALRPFIRQYWLTTARL